MRRVVHALAFGLALLLAGAAGAQDSRTGTTLYFATRDEAQAALVADDDWLRATGQVQRDATVGEAGPVTLEQFKAALARAGRDCDPDEVARWSSAFGGLAGHALLLLRLLPPVTVVCTDGSDSANAPYTRGQAVFFPRGIRPSSVTDAELLAHELFHIASRRHPDLATKLYALLGFEPARALEWPAQWAALRIANPDAPHHRHAMRIGTPNGAFAVMPVLVATRPVRGRESFFDVLQVRLLAVQPGAPGGSSKPLRDAGGALVWFPAEQAVDYLRKLGGNTAYVFHPEETMADNVAFLVSGRPVRNPALLERIRAVLAAASSQPER